MERNLMNELTEGIGALGQLRKQREKIKQWEECADNLVDYAHEFVAHLSTWGKGYDRNDKQIKQAEDAIEQYKNLKNGTVQN